MSVNFCLRLQVRPVSNIARVMHPFTWWQNVSISSLCWRCGHQFGGVQEGAVHAAFGGVKEHDHVQLMKFPCKFQQNVIGFQNNVSIRTAHADISL